MEPRASALPIRYIVRIDDEPLIDKLASLRTWTVSGDGLLEMTCTTADRWNQDSAGGILRTAMFLNGQVTYRPTTLVVGDVAYPVSVELGGCNEYHLWSAEHAKWWRSDGHGYASDLIDAGRYNHATALRYATDYHAPDEVDVMVPAGSVIWVPLGAQI